LYIGSKFFEPNYTAMRSHLLIIFCFSTASVFFSCSSNKPEGTAPAYAIVLHGGAGNIAEDALTPEAADACKASMLEALEAGIRLLESGADATEAVVATIAILEDSPLFNAGKGAVFTHDGRNELDASIMQGKDMKAGAVAGIKTVKNPIKAARKVMEASEHVLLSGEGADRFAASQGLEIVDPSYFYTQPRYDALERALKAEKDTMTSEEESKRGTVGCVALDIHGNLCAGTSTGGMTNKRYGRIGDAPIIGAGTYALNETCGVSATGHGEYFIRYAVAHEISSLMRYKKLKVAEAAQQVIQGVLKPAGGEGGVICLDTEGNVAMEFNTTAMFRAYANHKGIKLAEIW
jgi:beta-aspartyl-peptidase (threonine type)